MTELEKAVMEPEISETEITEAEIEATEISASEEALRESSEKVERMKQEIKAENEQLNIKFTQVKLTQQPRPPQKRKYHYVGTLSAAASLILMGITMTISLFSPTGILTALKFAPLMLVFLGLEVGLAVFRNRSVRLRYNAKSLILTFLLVTVTFVMSLISASNTAAGGERHYAEERLQNMLEREISNEISDDFVKDVVIQIHLYGDDPSEYDSIKDLEDSDVIDLGIHFVDADITMYEFAGNCRDIMNSLMKMPYNFGMVSFIAEDDINSYRMDVNWLYQSDFSATELVPLINYFGNDIVMDIPDLIEREE